MGITEEKEKLLCAAQKELDEALTAAQNKFNLARDEAKKKLDDALASAEEAHDAIISAALDKLCEIQILTLDKLRETQTLAWDAFIVSCRPASEEYIKIEYQERINFEEATKRAQKEYAESCRLAGKTCDAAIKAAHIGYEALVTKLRENEIDNGMEVKNDQC